MSTSLRVLFCIGVTPAFFDAGPAERKHVFDALTTGFADLRGRFGVEVLATHDDDQLMVGATETWRWTSCVIADAPDLTAAIAVCNILRDTELPSSVKLWKYLRIEARVGRPLFFATS
jgi:hypothetical protein